MFRLKRNGIALSRAASRIQLTMLMHNLQCEDGFDVHRRNRRLRRKVKIGEAV